jgi:hypothetical protein
MGFATIAWGVGGALESGEGIDRIEPGVHAHSGEKQGAAHGGWSLRGAGWACGACGFPCRQGFDAGSGWADNRTVH